MPGYIIIADFTDQAIKAYAILYESALTLQPSFKHEEIELADS